jgi:Ca2+-binding RTX toxin-like protein
MNILEYYKYAQLATAAYVRLGAGAWDGVRFAALAASKEQQRLPLSIGEYLFAPTQELPNPNPWNIRYYYGSDNTNDPIASADLSGFGATLFQQGPNGEKVLALRGTEPFADGLADLAVDVAQIGVLGMALSQVVSMVNLIQRLKAPKDSLVQQISVTASYQQGPGVNIPVASTDGRALYLTLDTFNGTGLGAIQAGEEITVTGHSLGGHLAMFAAWLFPEVVRADVYLYNAPGYDPSAAGMLDSPEVEAAFKAYFAGVFGAASADLSIHAQRLTNEVVQGLDLLLLDSNASLAKFRFHNLESENLAPGDDLSLVSSWLTNQQVLGPQIPIPTEPNSHVIEPLMDALALHAVLYRLNTDLTLADNQRLLRAAAAQENRSEEAVTEALFRLLRPNETFLSSRTGGTPTYGDQLATSDAIGPLDNLGWVQKGDLAARDAFHDAVLRIQQRIDDAGNLRLELLLDKSANDIILAAANPDPTNSAARAYRYALKALNPFALIGADYSPHNANGELDLFDAISEQGDITTPWLQDRADFLALRIRVNQADSTSNARPGPDMIDYLDLASGVQARLISSLFSQVARRVTFGTDGSDELSGSIRNDHLYGGSGADSIQGGDGNDYIEGNAGNDPSLLGGAGDDEIHGGAGDDVLRGEADADTLYGEAGEDWLWGDAGSDSLYGGKDIDRLYGGSEGDRLFGGEAGDYLYGEAHSDWLDGGAGDDRLEGGEGIDVYVLQVGAGRDTIVDSGTNTLMFLDAQGKTIEVRDLVGYRSGPNQWQNAAGSVTFNMNSPLTVSLANGIEFVVENFEDGMFGIHLEEPAQAPQTTLQIRGDLALQLFEEQQVVTDYDENGQPIGSHTITVLVTRRDENQNYIRTDTVEPMADILFGSAGADLMQGGERNDQLSGKAGDDLLEGGAGSDVLIGDQDATYPESVSGNDWLFADVQVALDAVRAQTSAQASGQRGDWLTGGLGEDVLVGDTGDDVLLGGGGEDTLIGGAGDDALNGDVNYVPDAFSLQSWTVEASPSNPFDWLYRAVYIVAEDWQLVGAGDFLHGGAGNDRIAGLVGDDVLDGGDGDDVLAAGPGDDIAYGGAGNDRISGEEGYRYERLADYGADQLYGEDGDDLIWGEGGADVLIGGAGNDELLGDLDDLDPSVQGDDYLDGGEGDDTLVGFGGDDRLYGGEGADYLEGDSAGTLGETGGDDTLDGGAGDDELLGGAGRDTLFGGEGNDRLFGDADNVPVAYQMDDELWGESGDDQLRGYGGNDALDGGEGQDLLIGDEGEDLLYGGAGTDLLLAGAGNDIALGGAGDDQIGGGDGSDYLEGEDGADQLLGEAGDDVLDGGGGDDLLDGGEGHDWLIGGGGVDQLQGGAGDDRYEIDRFDRVVDTEGQSTIRFVDATVVDEVAVTSQATPTGPLYTFTIEAGSFFSGAPNALAPAVFEFADGASLTTDQVLERRFTGAQLRFASQAPDTALRGYAGNDFLLGEADDDVLLGNAGNDTLVGGDGSDTLDGGPGRDELRGGPGSDVYRFGLGEGHDTLADEGEADDFDVIEIAAGIALGEVVLSRAGNGDLTLSVGFSGDSLTVLGQYTDIGNRIEEIRFAEGGTISLSQLNALSAEISGTDAGELLVGTAYAETLKGRGGGDLLDGRAGDDLLDGGAGLDTYLLQPGGGHDTLSDTSPEGSVVRIGAGLSVADVGAYRDGDDLVLRLVEWGDSTTVAGYFAQPHALLVQDGAGETRTPEALIQATELAELDRYRALRNRYIASRRSEFADEFSARGFTPTAGGGLVRVAQSGRVEATFTTGSGSVYSDIEYFSGQTVVVDNFSYSMDRWDYRTTPRRETTTALLQLQTVVADDDYIAAQSGARTQTQSAWELAWVGLDWTLTWRGDQVTWSASSSGPQPGPDYGPDGEPIPIGIWHSFASQSYHQGSAVAAIVALPENFLPYYPDYRQLYPGWMSQNQRSVSIVQTLVETKAGDADNEIVGGDLVDGGAGDDLIRFAGFAYGGDGNDALYAGMLLLGGAGDDYLSNAGYFGPWGELYGGEGSDTLQSGALQFGEGGADYLSFGQVLDGGSGDDQLAFGEVLRGGSGEDLLIDGRVLDGGSGDDLLYGRASGTDFVLRPDDVGHDRIYASGWERDPQVPLPAANDWLALAPLHAAGLLPDNRVIVEGAGASDVTVTWHEALTAPDGDPAGRKSMHAVLRIALGAGASADVLIPHAEGRLGSLVAEFVLPDQTLDFGELMAAVPPSVSLDPQELDNLLTGGAESDWLAGYGGQDVLQGQGGDDTLEGGAGSDQLSGGQGNDSLYGGADDDALLGEAGDDLLYGGTGDGSGASGDDLLMGAEGNDALHGEDGADTLTGGADDDVLVGGEDSDTYTIALGDGHDAIYDESGTLDTLVFGPGITAAEVSVARDLDAIVLTLPGGAQSVRLGDWYYTSQARIERVLFDDGTQWSDAQLEALAGGPNTAPVLVSALPDLTARVGVPFDYLVPLGTFFDPDAGDALFLTAARPGGEPLPWWWLSFDGTRFTGTPSETDLGNIEVEVSAYDGAGAWVSDTFILRVTNANAAPVLDQPLPDASGQEDVAFTYTVAADAFSDPDPGDTLTYSALLDGGGALPAWLAFNASTRSFSGTPGYGEGGSFAIRVTATDSAQESVYDEFQLVIAPQAPRSLTGTSGPDTLSGGSGNDSLDGKAGADTLIGRLGDDTYIVDNAADLVIEQANEGLDTIQSSVSFTLPDHVEQLILLTGSNLTGTGNALANLLTGNAGANTLDGGAGNDVIDGGSGADSLYGSDGDDTFLVAGYDPNAVDLFNGGDGFDQILGGAGDDVIRVNSYQGVNTVERIDGGAGLNTLGGNGGNNVIDLSGTQLIGIARIEGLGGADTLTGSTGNDVIDGGLGADSLYGGEGDDTFLISGYDANAVDLFNGGAGFDQILGGAGDDVIRVGSYQGADTVERIDGGAGLNTIGGNGGNNVIDLSGTQLIGIARIEGLGGADTITGSAGNDVIDGGLGADSLYGGEGDDTFLLAGYDANAVDLFNGGVGFDQILGSAGDDVIRMNSYQGVNSVERIDGGGGTNSIGGTGGGDTLDFSTTELLNIGSIDGGAGPDSITGAGSPDFLLGRAGADTLDGGAGNDLLQGGSEADILRGGEGNDLLDSGSANDTLQGQAGSDFLAGGAGNDSLNPGGGADVISANRGDGQDLVALNAAIERLTLSLGGGIAYADLALRKVGNDLVLETGSNESVTLDEWYAAGAQPPQHLSLQTITEAMAAFDASSPDPLLNRKVQQFDFKLLAQQYDAARAGDPTLDRWTLMNRLLDARLAASDSEALGGDLAYQYGRSGTLAGIGTSAARDVLAAATFGAQAQSLHTLAELQQGPVRLA